jgi:hypothetical protein
MLLPTSDSRTGGSVTSARRCSSMVMRLRAPVRRAVVTTLKASTLSCRMTLLPTSDSRTGGSVTSARRCSSTVMRPKAPVRPAVVTMLKASTSSCRTQTANPADPISPNFCGGSRADRSASRPTCPPAEPSARDEPTREVEALLLSPHRAGAMTDARYETASGPQPTPLSFCAACPHSPAGALSARLRSAPARSPLSVSYRAVA